MNELLEIQKISTTKIPVIVDLANRAWPATYKDILPEAQIKYMMDLFYTSEALKAQMIEKQHRFILAAYKEIPAGFASYSDTPERGVFKLHKLYVLPEYQGKGIGKELIDHIINDIRKSSAQILALNVNRNNNAKAFYEKSGFSVTNEEDIDIGNGYYMNDFVMQRKIQ
jgi:ribosomal protein S18 acetylase RimI-like enzyme